ncbi:hypothetical protein BG003_002338 [Podila horticola]|nr:hypothetical protein BG003_002338 [Podila horticola]
MLRNVYLHSLVFFLLTIAALGVQLLSLSKFIDQRVDANQDALKNYINYLSTGCNSAFAVLMFSLGFLFTRDIVWHLGERPGSKRFNMAWSLSPELSAAVTGIRIGGLKWIVVGCALTLITAISLVRNVWLTLSIQIVPHVSVGPMSNFSISTIHANPDNSDNQSQLSRQPYLDSFANEMMMGLKGSTVLHSDNGEYIWSPWLTDRRVSEILIDNYLTVALKPKCTLLKPTQVTWKINAANDSIAINVAAKLYNTSEPAQLYLTGPRLRTSWNTTALKMAHGGLPAYIMSYNVFGTVTGADNSTNYTFANDATLLKAYVYACRIDINQYNISGKITSNPGPSLDRLQLTSKILSPGDFDGVSELMYSAVFQALTASGASANQLQVGETAMEICRPIQCWMIDSIPGIDTGYNSTVDGPTTTLINDQGWIGMTPALLEYKLVQAVGYVISPSILTSQDTILGSNVTHDFIMQTTPKYIYAGVGLQLVLVLLVVGLYIATVTDSRAGYSDDLEYLVSLLREEDMVHEDRFALKGRQEL